MVIKMKVAVVGLGVEGIHAVESLLNHGYHVYASDINQNIELRAHKNLDVDLGFHDFNKIENADAVVLSPSLWNNEKFQKFKASKKLLSDIIKTPETTCWVGITGTNGKTTTTMMLKDIMENAGFKVLSGGNAGGGFNGYTEVILEAASQHYDVVLVEVCDMTLDFTGCNINFDIVVVTNLGRDHMEFHQSMDNYLNSIKRFINGKKVVLSQEYDKFNLSDFSDETYYFTKFPHKLKLFGNFNLKNAASAAKAAEIMGINPKTIERSLKEFNALPGRSTIIDLPHSRIVVGKTDNADATSAVLEEAEFQVIVLGTPRKGELCRLEVFREVSKSSSEVIAIFPGLDDTCQDALNILKDENYPGQVVSLEDVDEVVEFTLKCSKKYPNVFIGGNGQHKIIKITEILKEAVSAK